MWLLAGEPPLLLCVVMLCWRSGAITSTTSTTSTTSPTPTTHQWTVTHHTLYCLCYCWTDCQPSVCAGPLWECCQWDAPRSGSLSQLQQPVSVPPEASPSPDQYNADQAARWSHTALQTATSDFGIQLFRRRQQVPKLQQIRRIV